MQLFVRSLNGCYALECDSSTFVSTVKDIIFTKEGICPEDQRLCLEGRQLEDGDVLSECGVVPYCTLHLSLRLLGAGKKRKKKTYTTPKKIRHKHKKVKLAVLKYYKVDDSGKITRMRKECPSKDCGAGVFMAQHYNRMACGKCHLTYMSDKAGGHE